MPAPTEDEKRQALDELGRGLGFITRDIDAYITGRHGDAVQAGPFAGTRLVAFQPGGFHSHYFIGSFEAELHDAFARLIGRDYAQIVNVGGSEGYYAIGLARHVADAPVVVFEAEARLHDVIRANAEANGVADRVALEGLCDLDALAGTLIDDAIVVVDCEGCEVDILDPARVPALKTATVVVELHDCFRSDASTVVPPRFATTHDIEIVEVQGRDVTAYPALADMPQFQQYLAVCEFRPPNIRWGVFTPKAQASSAS